MDGEMAEVILGKQLAAQRGKERQEDLVARMGATSVVLRGLTQKKYSSWEGGVRPPYEAVLALADFWDVEIRWLITGEGEKKRRPQGEAERVLAEIRRLLEAPSLRSADPDDLRDDAKAIEAVRAKNSPAVPPLLRAGGDGE